MQKKNLIKALYFELTLYFGKYGSKQHCTLVLNQSKLLFHAFKPNYIVVYKPKPKGQCCFKLQCPYKKKKIKVEGYNIISLVSN